MPWTPSREPVHLMSWLTVGVWVAGLIARTVEDIQFLDAIFNDCPRTDQDVSLEGLRIGYPYNWWDDLGEEVCCGLVDAGQGREQCAPGSSLRSASSAALNSFWGNTDPASVHRCSGGSGGGRRAPR